MREREREGGGARERESSGKSFGRLPARPYFDYLSLLRVGTGNKHFNRGGVAGVYVWCCTVKGTHEIGTR